MAKGQKGVAWEKAVLDYVLGGTRPAALSTVYFALFTSNPTTSTDTATEVSGGSYARAAIANTAGNFPAASKTGTDPATKSNANAIAFPAATADWGSITGIGIYSASSGGTLFYWIPITGVSVMNGQTFSIAANAITVTEL